METPPPPTVAPVRRRSGVRTFAKIALLLVVLIVVAGAAVVYFAPSLVANNCRSLIADAFAEQFEGKLALGRFDLSWSGPQKIEGVELLGPDGTPIVRASLELPSIPTLFQHEKLGKIRIELSGDLVADDAGRTNLERALAPRHPAPPAKAPIASAPPATPPPAPRPAPRSDAGDWREAARAIDVEIEIVADHFTWSDARTRASGTPIRLEHFAATARLAEGASATLALTSQLIAGTARKLAVDAKVERPFEPLDAKAPPHADVTVAIEALPTGFVDALAGLGGRLTQSLGDTFDLKVRASGTANSGDATIDLKGPNASIDLDARLEGGVVRGRERRALSVALAREPDFLAPLLAGALPPATALARGSDRKLEITLDDLSLPLTALLDASAAHGDGVALLLERAQARLALSLGDWSYRDTALAAKSQTLALAGLHATATLGLGANGAADAGRLDVDLGARTPGANGGDLHVTVNGDARALARVADGGALPELALAVEVAAPTALLAAWAGDAGPRIAEFGESLHVRLDTTASLAARGASGGAGGTGDLARLTAKTKVALDVPGETQALGVPWHPHLEVAAEATAGGGATATITWPSLKRGAANGGSLQVASDGLAALAGDPLRAPASFTLDTGVIPTAVVAKFAGPDAHLDGGAGAGEELSVKLSGEWKERTLRTTGDGLALDVGVDRKLVESLLAGALPAGTTLAPVPQEQRLAITLKQLVLPLAPLLERKAGAPFDPASHLAGASATLHASLGGWKYQDAQLAAAKTSLDVEGLALDVGVESKGAALATDVELSAVPGAGATFTAKVHADDALAFTKIESARAYAPAHVEVAAKGLRSAVVDALCGGGGTLAKELGERCGLALALDTSWKKSDPIALAGTVACDLKPAPATLTLDARLADPFAARAQSRPPDVQAKLAIQGTAAALALVPAEWRKFAADALGDAVSLELSNRTRANAADQDVTFNVAMPGLHVDGAATIEKQTLKIAAPQRITLNAPVPAALVEQLLGAKLPKGTTLALAKSGDPVALTVTGLELPLDPWLAPRAAGAAPPSLAAALDRMTARLALALPSLVFTQAAAKAGEPPAVATLSNLALAPVELDPGKLAVAKLTGSVAATPPGSIELAVTGDHPFGLLGDAPATLKPALHLKGRLASIPTALVDALAQQDGFVVDVAGPTLALDVAGSWPSAAGDALRVKLDTPKANATLEAKAQEHEQLLVASGPAGLDAKVGVTPLFGKRVVGSLVPLMVDVQQADPAQRATVTLREFRLPLSGDLRQFDSDVLLDLGTLSFRFLPGVVDVLVSTGAGATARKIDPIAIQIRKGVARYDSIAIPVGGSKLVFKGSYDLVDQKLDMQTKVPLKWLGKSALAALGKAKSFLDENTEVPLDVRGTKDHPSVSIDKKFVEDALRKAAEDALGGLLRKKKGG